MYGTTLALALITAFAALAVTVAFFVRREHFCAWTALLTQLVIPLAANRMSPASFENQDQLIAFQVFIATIPKLGFVMLATKYLLQRRSAGSSSAPDSR